MYILDICVCAIVNYHLKFTFSLSSVRRAQSGTSTHLSGITELQNCDEHTDVTELSDEATRHVAYFASLLGIAEYMHPDIRDIYIRTVKLAITKHNVNVAFITKWLKAGD